MLRAHIANLRRKIEAADGARLIHTDHGVGYRLVDVLAADARRARPAEAAIDRELVRPMGGSTDGALLRRVGHAWHNGLHV
jgi:DNA-binding winged helix-turn-helix (wHTH) protein